MNTDKSGDFEGIGLNNVKKRLEILYMDRHKLDIEENKDVFRIKLELEFENVL
jgi:sensor histidine kinase YesM